MGKYDFKNVVILLKVLLLKKTFFNSYFSEISAHFGILMLISSILLCKEIQCVCKCIFMCEQTFLCVKWMIDNPLFCKLIHTTLLMHKMEAD